MNAYNVLIFLSGLVVFSYLFDLVARRTRLPSVLLLLGVGIGLRMLADSWGYYMPQLDLILPTLGNVGLILIVFEGALELEYTPERRTVIRRSFGAGLVLLLLTTTAIAAILHHFTGAGLHQCLANAVPLSVISSSVAIPSASGLRKGDREFVVYESSFSDILGIVLFDFVVSNERFGIGAFSKLGVELSGVVVLSALASLVLLWLVGQIRHHVKFFLILALVVMLYGLGKLIHLSSLVLVLGFGLVLANVHQIPVEWIRKHFLYDRFEKDLAQFHSLSSESAFLIRTFFFVLFGYSVVARDLLDRDAALLCGAVLAATYLLRALYLKLAVRGSVAPLLFLSPRGLISVLLYLSLPATLRIPEISLPLLFLIVLGSCLVMAIGLVLSGQPPKADAE